MDVEEEEEKEKKKMAELISRVLDDEKNKEEIKDSAKHVIAGDRRHIILVLETIQDDFIETNSISPSQNLVEMSNLRDLILGGFDFDTLEMTIASGDVNFEGKRCGSVKEEVCQVHSLPQFMSHLVNTVVKMMNSEINLGRIDDEHDDVFQVQDVITGDQSMNLVVETTQDGFNSTNSITSSQEMIRPDEINWGKWREPSSLGGSCSKGMSSEIGSTHIVSGYGCARKETASSIALDKKRARIGCDEIKWGKCSASGSSSNNGVSAEIGSTHIVSGYGFARKEMVSSIALGKKRARICFENTRQQVEKYFGREFTERKLEKDVLSMFVEARNVFCQKKLNGYKQSYSREEMEGLRFVNAYQQRQIWREIYTGLGPVVAKQLNQLSEARQNGKAITDQKKQQQQHYHPQLHHQHPQQQQQHHRYPLQHHQYSQQQQQHYHPQPHHQHPRQHQEHHRYPLQHHQYSQKQQHYHPQPHHRYPLESLQHHHYSQQQQQEHHQLPTKPLQHHHHQHQLAGVHGENTSILGAGTDTERPVH